MDNYFQECPPMMNDGRLFTDYRSSQVREELFKHKKCIMSENEARTLRIENAEDILDNEWEQIRQSKSCHPKKRCYHKYPTTRVTTAYNNAEILAYNGMIPAPICDSQCYDFRATSTQGRNKLKKSCVSIQSTPCYGYPANKCPNKCPRSNREVPDRLYNDEQ